jgi:hypothetical protein
MIKKNLAFILIINVFIICMAFKPGINESHLLNPTEWKLEKTGNDIKVYTRQSEGSSIKEFKAVTTVTANMKSLESLIENVSDYPNWQTNIATAKILKQVNKTEQYIYYTTDLPWPMTDRDVVIFSEKTVEVDGTVRYNILSKPDYITGTDDFLRIKNAKGIWQLTPQGNKIEIIYQFYGDPAGSIPSSIINMFIVDGPYSTLLNMKKKVGK